MLSNLKEAYIHETVMVRECTFIKENILISQRPPFPFTCRYLEGKHQPLLNHIQSGVNMTWMRVWCYQLPQGHVGSKPKSQEAHQANENVLGYGPAAETFRVICDNL